MKTESAYQTKDEMESRKLLSKDDEWLSRFDFLRAHHGYRPGRFHVILGPTSAGKSTLVRSLLMDAISSGKKRVLLWLSEESIDEFKTELAFTEFEHEALKNVTMVSEQDGAGSNQHIFQDMRLLAGEYKPNLIMLDNITTSRFYNDIHPSKQSEFCLQLKQIAKELNTPMVIFAHTNAEVSGNVKYPINENHVRGSKSIVNLAEFLYIMQKVEPQTGGIYSFLRTVKHRGQDVQSKLHYLDYHAKGRIFTGDRKCDFQKFKEILRELP